MNILSDDGKTIVRLKSWDDVFERHSFKQDVNPQAIKLKSIIGQYDLPDKRMCGLSSCKTPHGRGFLVVCSDNIETNIGHVCGKRHFGVNFDDLEKTFRRDLNVRDARENIENRIAESAVLKDTIDNLWSTDGLRLYCTIRDLKKDKLKGSLRVKLEKRANTNSAEISELIPASEKDIELEELRLDRDLTDREKEELAITHSVGRIYGIQAFTSFEKIRTILRKDLPLLFKQLDELDTSIMLEKEIIEWSKKLNSINSDLVTVRQAIEDSRRFIVPSNIEFIIANENLI